MSTALKKPATGYDRTAARPKRVVVHDLMQQGYTYSLTEPMGRNFHRDFHPELTPKQMLELGVFGGKYMTDCRAEFPIEWFEKARLSPTHHDAARLTVLE